MDLRLHDVLELKKEHPCGSKRWQVLRVGMDIKLRCLGCGHEHNCGIHGCALLLEAAERIKRMDKQLREYGDCHTCVHDKPCGYDDITCVACERSENWEWGVSNG